jgi:hypothetical protein
VLLVVFLFLVLVVVIAVILALRVVVLLTFPVAFGSRGLPRVVVPLLFPLRLLVLFCPASLGHPEPCRDATQRAPRQEAKERASTVTPAGHRSGQRIELSVVHESRLLGRRQPADLLSRWLSAARV